MSRNKKINRHLEEISKELTAFTYQKIKVDLDDEYYMRCDRNFSNMLRRGEVCTGEEN